MNKMQKLVIFIISPLAVVILPADHLFPGAAAVRLLKLTVLLLLFGLSLYIKWKYRSDYAEKKLLRLALFFAVLGDSLFVAGLFNLPLQVRAAFFGALAFLVAYALLLLVFQKTPFLGSSHILAALPVLALTIPVLADCCASLSGPLLGGVLFFALVLCGMAWRAVCTLIEGCYTKRAAWCFALAGYLILISDLAVARAVFDPVFAGSFSPCLQNIIWSAFISAWLLIDIVLAEKDLLEVIE